MPDVSCSWKKVKRCNGFFLKIFCSRNKIRQFFETRWQLTVERYFHIDENASSEQIYALLDNVESADKDYLDSLMNDSDSEFRAEEEITQAAKAPDTSLTTPEVNIIHVLPSENQSKKKEKNNKEEL